MTHGTNGGYRAGCRDECCRTAHADYKRALRAKRYIKRADRLYIDATGSQRRIRALIALGWTYADIDSRAGWGTCGNAHNITRQAKVHVDTEATIRRVYDELSMKLATGRYAGRQRKVAQRKGWLPPLAYDEGRIDDPDYTPALRPARKHKGDVDEAVVLRVLSGERLDTTPAERIEIVRRWLASGRSEADLCRITGWRGGRYVDREDVA